MLTKSETEPMSRNINNIDLITSLLSFRTVDDFYHLQIIKRKKEHKEIGSNSYVVKTYYITSVDYLMKKYEEIRVLCDYHNARACINLNRRSYEKMAYQMLIKVTNQIMNKDYKSVRKAYESVCGANNSETEKKWIVDIDVKDEDTITIISNTIKNCEPDRRLDKVCCVIPTKNGCHLITSPFNMAEFKVYHPDIEVHKDNPTLLYVPVI